MNVFTTFVSGGKKQAESHDIALQCDMTSNNRQPLYNQQEMYHPIQPLEYYSELSLDKGHLRNGDQANRN